MKIFPIQSSGVRLTSFLWALFVGLSSLPCHGREVRFLAWDDAVASRSLVFAMGDKQQPIERLHSLQRSQPITIPTTHEGVGFFRIQNSAAEFSNETTYLPIDIPDTIQSPLVVLLPSNEGPLRLGVRVFEDSEDDFAWGSFRIMNTTGHVLLLITRDSQHEIPGGWEPVDFNLNNNANEAVVIAIRDPNQELLMVYSTIWMPDPRARRLVMIMPAENQRLGLVALKVIPEFSTSRSPASRSRRQSDN